MTDDVPVLTADLELIGNVLTTVHSYLHAGDLRDQYRKLDNRNRRSPLTNSVADVLGKVLAYREAAEEEEVADDE